VLYNIPADSHHLPEGLPTSPKLTGGILQGRTDFGRTGYGGPCPPPGVVHHYGFVIYALDKQLGLKEGSTRQQILDAITGHILAEGQLIGTYRR
jgi:Raf kinase inhibitor-like YbhB/YbcL family protein